MRKYHLVAFTLIFVAMSISYAYGQSAKEALKALKKMEARCQVGILYKDYSPVLGDAKYEINIYLESAGAKNNPILSNSIKKVMLHYENAAKVWQLKFDGTNEYGDKGQQTMLPIKSNLGRLVLMEYPKAAKVRRTRDGYGNELLVIDDLLKVIWDKASEELKNTTRLLSLQQD